MLRENQYVLRQISLVLDIILCVLAILVTDWIRQLLSEYIIPTRLKPGHISQYLWLVVAYPFVMILAMSFHGIYESIRIRTKTLDLIKRIGMACVESTLILIAMDNLLHERIRGWTEVLFQYEIDSVGRSSRAMFLLAPGMIFLFLVIKTFLLRRLLVLIRRRGLNYRRVLLVGSGKPLEEFAGMIANHPLWGMRIKGIITDIPGLQGSSFNPESIPEAELFNHDDPRESPVFSDLEGAPSLLWRTSIDEVIMLPGSANLEQLRPLMEVCEEMGVRTHMPLNFFPTTIARPVMDRFEDIPVLSYWSTRDIGPTLLFKYAFDRIAALVLLLLLFIPLILVAVIIRLTSRAGEPVFYGQPRCGLNGRRFTCWKFRSMHVGADQLREELEVMNEQEGPIFKMQKDPRVTRFGRFIRKYSIDEFPQLWNVIKGDMSLVGPRPPLPQEIEQYDRWQRRRLSMKPGLTCLWQVSGRNHLSFDAWMKLDLDYIDNWSLTLDFKILFKTVWVVLTGYGAM
jgi:exopolysaccharide biosynthesis polyprenyl glycosylphosphotransferase